MQILSPSDSEVSSKQLTEIKSVPKSQEKYSSSFESDISNDDKDNSELHSSKSQKSFIKSLSQHSENFSEENATLDDNYEISPDSSGHHSLPSIEKLPKAAENIDEKQIENVPSPDINYPKMLSTIEEVTSVADTEEESIISSQIEISSEIQNKSSEYIKSDNPNI